jgi:hypothetical protein
VPVIGFFVYSHCWVGIQARGRVISLLYVVSAGFLRKSCVDDGMGRSGSGGYMLRICLHSAYLQTGRSDRYRVFPREFWLPE